MRMDLYVTTNPSGTRGGGMYRDKFNEVQVNVVKKAMLNQRSALSDLSVQTLISSMSVMQSVHRHNLKSRLYEEHGRGTSSDTVGDAKRSILKELMVKCDPFNLERAPVTDFSHKPRGSPWDGLTMEMMEDFIQAVKLEFELLYPSSCSSLDPTVRTKHIEALLKARGLDE